MCVFSRNNIKVCACVLQLFNSWPATRKLLAKTHGSCSLQVLMKMTLVFSLLKMFWEGGRVSANACQWCQRFICATILTQNSLTSSSSSCPSSPCICSFTAPPPPHSPPEPPLFTLPSCRSFHPFFNSALLHPPRSPSLPVLTLHLLFLIHVLPTFFLSHLCPHLFPRFEAPLHLHVFIQFWGQVSRFLCTFLPCPPLCHFFVSFPSMQPLSPTFCSAQGQVERNMAAATNQLPAARQLKKM